MFEDLLVTNKDEKCCGGCEPDCGCDCSPETEGACYDVDQVPCVKEGIAEWRTYQPTNDIEANRNFLLRWKRDIEDGIEEPLGYKEILNVMRNFGEDLVDEVGIAYAGWEAEDDPDELEYGVFDRERSLSIRAARSTMKTVFQQDPDLKQAYIDNIAMAIYDVGAQRHWMQIKKEIRDEMAEAVLKLIFD